MPIIIVLYLALNHREKLDYSSHTCIDIQFHTKPQEVHLLFGMLLSAHRHTSLFFHLIQHLVTYLNSLYFMSRWIVEQKKNETLAGTYTPQYEWLQTELTKVDRTKTPWLIVIVHSPLYNTNNYHYMEGEGMRVMFESWFVENKVDIVLSGHVHSYERMVLNYICFRTLQHCYIICNLCLLILLLLSLQERVSNIVYNISNKKCTPVKSEDAPVYLNLGDGGNIEGLAAE